MEFALCYVWQTQVCVLGTASGDTMAGSHFDSKRETDRQGEREKNRQTGRQIRLYQLVACVDDILTCVVVSQSISVNFCEEKRNIFRFMIFRSAVAFV